MSKLILAFDLGTGGNKATLFDAEGNCLASTFVEYQTHYPHLGWHEQSPESWFQAVVSSTKQLLNETNVNRNDIVGLAISGHSLGSVPLDRQGRLLREQTPIWSDCRAEEEAKRFFEKIAPQDWYQITGNGFSPPHYTIFKILWYQKHEPEMFKKVDRIVGTKDYINYRLTGRLATDPGYASGCGVWNLRNGQYDPDLLKLSGLDPSLFPEVIASTDIVGTLTSQAAKELGLSSNLAVVCGSVDNSCMALGAGNTKRGRMYASFGSSSWIALASDKLVLDEKSQPYVFAHVIPNFYTIALALFSSGTTFRWLKENLCNDLRRESEKTGRNIYELMIDEAKKAPIGSHGLIMNPNFAGGATHDHCPGMRGGFLHLDLSHTRADMIRSTMEAIAFGMKYILDSLGKEMTCENHMTVVGGGSLSSFWRQIYADVMNITLEKTNIDLNAASLGAAALAALGTGIWKSFDIIDEIVNVTERTEPQPQMVQRYLEFYEKFKIARELMIQYEERTAQA